LLSFTEWKEKTDDFLKICKYFQGNYDEASFTKLNNELDKLEDGNGSRIFYMAIPPENFVESARCIKKCCQVIISIVCRP
jgi:glucose-6-phosphate 1-dehydrogenase